MLIDTHAHLNFRDYEKDLDQVIKRAGKTGVRKIICVSSNIEDSKKAIEIAKKYPGIVYAAVGIHPQQTDPQNTDSLIKQIEQLEKLAQAKEVVAIGECGLDYSPTPPEEKDRSKQDQDFLFKKQIELAIKLKLPIIIHSRKAFAETIYTLKAKSYKLRGVLHCYSAGKKGINQITDLGFYFGFDGNLTYDLGLQNIAQLIPLDKILLETDCPFLSPLPFRGQRNEPAYLIEITKTLAKIRQTSVRKIAQSTFSNTQRLFMLK